MKGMSLGEDVVERMPLGEDVMKKKMSFGVDEVWRRKYQMNIKEE